MIITWSRGAEALYQLNVGVAVWTWHAPPAVVAAPTSEGLEWTAAENRLHWTAPTNRLHWVADDDD